MGIIDCMVFAVRDLVNKGKNTIRTVLCFFVLQFLIILWLLISMVLPRMQAELKYNSDKNRYIVSYVDVDVSGNMLAESDGYKVKDYLTDKDYIRSYNPMYSDIDMVRYSGMQERWSYINCDWLSISLHDGNTHTEYPASGTNGCELLTVASGDSCFYSETEYECYISGYEDSYEGAMICGRPLLNESELILSDTLMKIFVDDEEKWNDLIGKKITIKSKDKTLVEDYTLSGIYDHRFFREDRESEDPDLDYLIFIRCTPQDLAKYSVERFRMVLYFKEDVNFVLALNELSKAGFDNIIPSDEAVFSVYSEEVMHNTGVILNELVSSLGSVISVAILFYLATTIYIEKKNKSAYIGMLKSMGLENGRIFLISCFQQLLVSILAAIPSGVFSVLSVQLINKILEYSIGISLKATVTDYVIVISIGILSTVIAGVLLYLPAVVSFMRSSPVRLMEEY
ncbi:MAG: ABC transporter permease [Saccharofermentans sp.]|nr:ABC transporter permease [Saccharofermentans sp.]